MAQPAAVREPSEADVAGFMDLADVFTWAKIKGRLECPGSRAGSLLRLVATSDWAECEIEDMASVSPDDFEGLLGAWAFCGDYGDELEDSAWGEEIAMLEYFGCRLCLSRSWRSTLLSRSIALRR